MAQPQRKKKRVHLSRCPPFPIPISSITTEPARADRWFYYTGVYNGTRITVHHSGDISFLCKMGFFGKGSLSRGMPEYNQLQKKVYLKHNEKQDEAERFNVMCKRKYTNHLKWRNELVGHVDDVDDDEDGEKDEREEESINLSEYNRELHENKNLFNQFCLESKDITFVPETTENSVDKIENAEFKCESNAMKRLEDTWEQSEADVDFWSITEANDDTQKIRRSVSQPIPDLPTISEQNMMPDITGLAQDKDERCENELISQDKIPCNPTKLVNTQMSPSHISEFSTQSQDCYIGSKSSVDESSCTKTEDMAPDQTGTPSSACDVDEFLDVHPLCTDSDANGDIFVIDDSDEEGSRAKQKKWVPTIKCEPFHVNETLQLSLQEAFFLSYGLGCLNVVTTTNEPMSLSQMWKTFSQQERFLPKYIAYHYYRSKGWVPKCGLKFGTDYIIYKEGPAFYHGSFSVLVRMVDSKTLSESSQHSLSWRALSGLNRITEHVAKNLMMCYVIVPDVNSEELLSPACIPKFRVQEIEINRWISEQERGENKTRPSSP